MVSSIYIWEDESADKPAGNSNGEITGDCRESRGGGMPGEEDVVQWLFPICLKSPTR